MSDSALLNLPFGQKWKIRIIILKKMELQLVAERDQN